MKQIQLKYETDHLYHFNQLLEKYSGYYVFYTDGSKDNFRAGAGYFSAEASSGEIITDIASLTTAELYSILEVLQKMTTMSYENYLICSDSRSSLVILNNMYTTNTMVKKIQQAVRYLLTQSKKIIFIWVQSHIVIYGNEQAD